ncbi:MAG: MFS transporter [Methanothrix sp.]|nr:MAG: MFS transporter [Methanothrix sp.]
MQDTVAANARLHCVCSISGGHDHIRPVEAKAGVHNKWPGDCPPRHIHRSHPPDTGYEHINHLRDLADLPNAPGQNAPDPCINSPRQILFSRTGQLPLMQYTIIVGVLFILPLFLQIVLGYNALQAGIATLPISVPLLITTVLATRLALIASPKRIIQLGQICIGAGIMVIMLTIDAEVTGKELTTGLVLIGIGSGFLASQITNFVLSIVPQNKVSEASGIYTTIQNLGRSFGTSVVGTVLIAALAQGAITLIDESTVLDDTIKMKTENAVETHVRFISDTELESLMISTPPNIAQEVVRINDIASISAIKAALKAMLVFSIIALLISILLPGQKLLSQDPLQPS